MRELDRFDGVMIVTTNLFENYDPALLCRIQRHIQFRLPNTSMRRELITLHLPNPAWVTADYAVLAGLSRGLSSGDILNICLNAIHAGSTDPELERWVLTRAMIEIEINKARKAKAGHVLRGESITRWQGPQKLHLQIFCFSALAAPPDPKGR